MGVDCAIRQVRTLAPRTRCPSSRVFVFHGFGSPVDPKTAAGRPEDGRRRFQTGEQTPWKNKTGTKDNGSGS